MNAVGWVDILENTYEVPKIVSFCNSETNVVYLPSQSCNMNVRKRYRTGIEWSYQMLALVIAPANLGNGSSTNC